MLLEADGAPRQLTLMATGSELHLAAEARTVLQVEGVPTAVVSVPCAFIFNEQDLDYQRAVLGETLARVAVEAGVQMSWDRYLGFGGRSAVCTASVSPGRSRTSTGNSTLRPRRSCAPPGTA